MLQEFKTELQNRILGASRALSNTPAESCLGFHCSFCDVRQFCNPYWDSLDKDTKAAKDTFVDLEITVCSTSSEYGFDAKTLSGKKLPVVFQQDVAKVHGPFISEIP